MLSDCMISSPGIPCSSFGTVVMVPSKNGICITFV